MLKPTVRALCTVTVTTVAGCGGNSAPIALGLAGPLSQPRGVAMERAATLAVEEINARGGVRGRALTITMLDDSARPERAIRVAQELYIDRRIVAVVGHLTSGTTLAAAAIYNGGTTPVVALSPSASAPQISAAGPYIFRLCPSDEVHGAQLALWARQRLGASRAAVFYQNEDYGRGVRSTFSTQFDAAGGQVVESYPYVPETADFEPYAAHAVRVARADVALIAGARREGERLLTALRAQSPTLPVLASDGLAGIELAGDPADGVYVSAAWLPDSPNEESRRFVEAYRRAYAGDLPDHRGAAAYDVVRLLAQAIEAVGPDRERIRAFLTQVGGRRPAFDGVTGRIVFDQDGDVVGKPVVVGVARGGRLITASEAR